MEIPVHIGVRENLVLGIFHVATSQLDTPAVMIMCYGMNGNRVEQHRMSVKLGRLAETQNINLMRFDFLNQGISPGTFIKTTISSKIDDMLHVIKDIKGYFGNKKVKIYLIGFSDGARIAIDVGHSCKDVKGIILWNPIIRNPYTVDVSPNPNSTHEKFYIDKKNNMIYKKLLGVKLSATLIKEIKSDNIYELLRKTDKPIFYVFGSNDRFTKSLQGKIYDIGIFDKNKDSIHIVEGAAHIFASTYYENEVITNTIKWVKMQNKDMQICG